MKLFDTFYMEKQCKTILFVICYIIGIEGFLTDCITPFAILLFAMLFVAVSKHFVTEKYAIACFLVFLIGFINTSFRMKDYDELAAIAPKNEVTLTGKVVSLPSSSSEDFTKFSLKVQKYNLYKQAPKQVNSKILVTFFANKNVYENIETGDTISVTGRLTTPKSASNPSEFCYATYLRLQNIHARLFVNDGNFMLVSKPDKGVYKFLASLNRLRNKIVDMHATNIKSPELELLGGIVFGDDAVSPTPEMKTSFQHSGLTHIIAASGMNVSMIFGMWFFLSQIIRINYKLSIIIGMASVVCYTCMTGFGPPVLRATLMLLLILFGKLIDRKANSVTLLFIVALLMLLISPTMVTNIGFQLSFTVTLGLLSTCPLIFDKIKNKFLNVAASFVIVPIIAQFFAAPIQMFYFNSFSPYAVFANISVVPTLSIVSYLGFTSSILATIKPIAYYCVKFFDILLMPFLSFIVGVADFFSKLPYSNVTVPSPSIFQIILYYIILLSIIAYFAVENKKKLCVSLAVFSLILLTLTYIPYKNHKNEIVFFNVENADSFLIKTSTEKYILIDTGKAPFKTFSPAAERIILKYFEDKGINHLDMMILSHFDSDHSGGAIAITDKIPVEKIIIRSYNDNSPLAKKIKKQAKEKNIPLYVPKNLEIIYNDGENKINAIYSESGDDNDRSLINIFETPYGTVLFTGDSGVNSFEDLKKKMPQNVEILKVAHHGAKGTVSEEYLQCIKPKIAIISTGFNIYGHPNDETIDLLKKHNVKILRTDVDNAVKAVLDKNKILLYSYNNNKKRFERIDNEL